MPNSQDQRAIDSLFDRIEEVAQNSSPRDRDAEAQIQQRLRDYPPAPYYMAQTILVQEEALRQAQERIEQLQASTRPSGGFLGGLFGDAAPTQQTRTRGPWDRQEQPQQRGQGGGFLAGAAQTALGVTGGMLLGSAIAGMFTTGANAEEITPFDNADQDTDQDVDNGGDFDGGFDIGGDF
ncbi:DUF2076 domain-containing protein [Devosia sp. 2618]|uniref:DUF2076 domain-containing protein n=1 Tax=Devosia sp. 2618 TaxID=3156454 RepID=UPI0033949223